MFYQMGGKFFALNFKAQQKMSTLGKYCDFEHEKFAFFLSQRDPPWKLDKTTEEVKWDVFWN